MANCRRDRSTTVSEIISAPPRLGRNGRDYGCVAGPNRCSPTRSLPLTGTVGSVNQTVLMVSRMNSLISRMMPISRTRRVRQGDWGECCDMTELLNCPPPGYGESWLGESNPGFRWQALARPCIEAGAKRLPLPSYSWGYEGAPDIWSQRVRRRGFRPWPQTRSPACAGLLSFHQPPAERVAVGHAVVGPDAGNDGDHQGEQAHQHGQRKADEDPGQQGAGHQRQADGDLEVQRFLALLVDEGIQVLLQLPDDQRTDDVADHRRQEPGERRVVAEHRPAPGFRARGWCQRLIVVHGGLLAFQGHALQGEQLVQA